MNRDEAILHRVRQQAVNGSVKLASVVELRVLGGLEVAHGTDAITLPTGRPRALLAWLALHPGEHPRARLAARLWPDVLDESARASLRTALWTLRRCLGDGAGALISTGDHVELRADVDVRRMRALAADDPAGALALYGGDFAPGVDDDWALEARDALRTEAGLLLARAGAEAEAAGDLAVAIAHARRHIEVEPLEEAAHRDLMRRLAAAGDTAGALRAYERLAERLRADLGIPPSAQARALATELREGGSEQVPAGEAPTAVTTPLPVPARLSRFAAEPFVGRSDALAALASAMSDTRRAGARLVVIAGEPGIGKTRLLAQAAVAAAADGAQVLAGLSDQEALIAFQPFVEIAEQYVAARGAADVRARLGDRATDLASLLPGGALGSGPDGAEGRYRMHRALAALIGDVAGAAPLVLVLDDAQWAGRPTLLLARHLLRECRAAPLLVLAACREEALRGDHPFCEMLTELRREGIDAATLTLSGLDRDDVAALMHATAGEVAAEPERLHAESAGNPFLLTERLRQLGAGEAPDTVPAGISAAIGGRIAALQPPGPETLGFAALLGTRFADAPLQAATGVARDQLVDVLDGAVAAGLLAEGREPGSHRFRHALVRDAVLATLGATRRAHMHARLAEALEHCGGAPAAIAHHWGEAGGAGDPDRAYAATERAGEDALRRLAFEDAFRLFSRSLELLGAEDERRRHVVARRAMALMALYHLAHDGRQPGSDSGVTSPTISRIDRIS